MKTLRLVASNLPRLTSDRVQGVYTGEEPGILISQYTVINGKGALLLTELHCLIQIYTISHLGTLGTLHVRSALHPHFVLSDNLLLAGPAVWTG